MSIVEVYERKNEDALSPGYNQQYCKYIAV